MSPDDRICYCYNVTLGKLERFARRTKPARPSRMSECLGAGTGCGWCIPFLKRIAEDALVEKPAADPEGVSLTPEEYAQKRQTYIKTKQPKNKF